MPLDEIGSKRPTNEGKFPQLYQELLAIGDEVVKSLRESAISKELDASNQLIAGIRFEAKIFDRKYVWQLSLPDYYKWVDEGRKPGKQPPIEAIKEWMAFKGIRADISKRRSKLIRSLKSKRVKKGLKQVSQDRANTSLAFIIARNIAKKGTIKRFGHKGSNFYSNVITEEWLLGVKTRLAKSAKRDVLVEIKFYNK